MKIAILSFRTAERKASSEEIRLKKNAREKGHVCRIFRAHKFKLVFDRQSPWILYDGKPFPHYDIVVTRPSIIKFVDLYIALIEQMEISGMLVFNKYESILKAKNKIKTMQILDHYGIPIPKTVVVNRPEDIIRASKFVGGFPLIVKEPVGSFGSGVTIVESMRALKSMLIWDKPMYLLQEYVKYSRGKDLRVFVVNGKVVGSLMRSAQKGEFRSNIELGGKGGPAEITEEEASIALRSVQALDLSYGGVDIMRGKNGPVVLEVNSNPGFKALEEATEADIAGAIIDHAIELVDRHRKPINGGFEK